MKQILNYGEIMKTYLLSLFVILLTILALASAEERRLVKASPLGKHGPIWKYTTKAEPNKDCNYKSISNIKRIWPRTVNHKAGPK